MTTSSLRINGYTKEEVGKRWGIDPSLPDLEFEAEFRKRVQENSPSLKERIQNDPE